MDQLIPQLNEAEFYFVFVGTFFMVAGVIVGDDHLDIPCCLAPLNGQ